jgi:hypothetical protein
VELVAVGFDDERRAGEVEVDLDPGGKAGQRGVRAGVGKAVAPKELVRRLLELRSGVHGALGHDGAQRRRTAARAELLHAHEPLHLGLVHRPPQPAVVEDAGEVDDRAHRGRHRDAAMAGDVGRRQRADDVQADAAARTDTPRRRHVDRAASAPHRPPQRRRRDMAERRVGPDRGNGGDEDAVPGEIGVPDRVHAAVDGVEAADADAVLDRVRRDPDRPELARRHDSVLAGGEPRKPEVRGRLTFP